MIEYPTLTSAFSNEGHISYLITFFCWLIPLLTFTFYFWSIPCQVMIYAYVKIFHVLSVGQEEFAVDVNSYGNSRVNQGYWKAIITSLIIVGTYIICWMPAVTWFALTCIDVCPLPLFEQPVATRFIFGFITNALVVVKAICDPFIYCFRMKEINSAMSSLFHSHARRHNANFSFDSPSTTIHLRVNRSFITSTVNRNTCV
ncbi:hypothetical protein B4U79_18540 [Dinothrombium tinctorium]|uniref:G-protein coupled receptors family 1 profile domain-containing protein n=1 Tax=Dinothrombium tinctorium TaxID=1965070 RepID=A0A3S3NFP0_9ACAR|nr:hypothetical protein B4U79_18541 [Dinothrombium tinctorium]RWS01731.1 hypothetical protein B4U79_18540 [Dinothrombium tinctorium]